MTYPRRQGTRPAIVAAVAIVLSLLTVAPFGQAIDTPGQTLQAPPVQSPRPHDYHVDHYRVELAINLPDHSISGGTTITLEPLTSSLNHLELDAGDMKISRVALAGGPPLNYKYDGSQKLLINLDKPYSRGQQLTLSVNYSAVPKQGLTFISPNKSDPGRPYQVWSQGECQTNHYWFPCYDNPNDKATCETITTVDDKYRVISNGELIDVKPNPEAHTKTWHWEMDRPYSSYLTSIVVGQFDELQQRFKNIPVVSYVYPGQVEEARVSLGKIAEMVGFFSDKIGIEYPYPKYSETTVADFPGGMENISATTMTDTVVHDKRAQLDVSSDLLISHELAHQWFGDMLTCRDWGELWLNESFAEFFADLWTEHDLGTEQYLYEVRNNQTQYLEAWKGGLRRPLVTERYDDPDGLFDAYAYPRGAATVSMLRYVLGEELFWKALRHYAQKYEWQNVDTGNLIDAISEATGKDLHWFFDEWVYKMGHPIFDVSSAYDAASGTVKISVKQTQKPDPARPWFKSPEFFTTPVDVAITTGSGEQIHQILINAPQQEFSFKVDSKPLIINFDRGGRIIKQLNFPRSDEELAYQALHDSDAIGRLRAIDELAGHKSQSGNQALAQAAMNDSFWAVRNEAVAALSVVKDDFAKQALIQAVKDKDSRVRRAAVNGLAAYKDANLAPLFIGLTKNDPSYFVVADAAAALGTSHAAGAYDVLVGLLAEASWQDTIRGGALRGLAALKDPRAMALALKYAAAGNQPGLRAVALNVLAQDGKGDQRVFDALVSALNEGSEPMLVAAMQALGTLGDPRAIPLLEKLEQSPDFPPDARQAIEQVIARIKGSSNSGSQ